MKIDAEQILSYLKSAGIESSLLKISENVPIDTVLVPLLIDQSGKKIILQLMVPAKQPMPEDSNVPPSEFLQFFLGLPYSVEDELVMPLIRLLNVLNRSCEFGAFGLVEDEPYPFFRYTYLHKGEMNPEILLSLIGCIALIVENTIDLIADLASKTRTFEEILKELPY